MLKGASGERRAGSVADEIVAAGGQRAGTGGPEDGGTAAPRPPHAHAPDARRSTLDAPEVSA